MQKDYTQQSQRFQSGRTPMYGAQMSSGSQPGQIRSQPYFGGTPPMAQSQINLAPYRGISNYVPPYISPTQLVRAESYVQPMFPTPFPQASHGSSPVQVASLYTFYPGNQPSYQCMARQHLVTPATSQHVQQPQALSQVQPVPGQTPQSQPSQVAFEKKSVKVVIRNPHDNRDVTDEVLKPEPKVDRGQHPSLTPVEQTTRENQDKIRAQFAAQVAALAANKDSSENGGVDVFTENGQEQNKTGSKVKTSDNLSKSPIDRDPKVLRKHVETELETAKVTTTNTLQTEMEDETEHDLDIGSKTELTGQNQIEDFKSDSNVHQKTLREPVVTDDVSTATVVEQTQSNKENEDKINVKVVAPVAAPGEKDGTETDSTDGAVSEIRLEKVKVGSQVKSIETQIGIDRINKSHEHTRSSATAEDQSQMYRENKNQIKTESVPPPVLTIKDDTKVEGSDNAISVSGQEEDNAGSKIKNIETQVMNNSIDKPQVEHVLNIQREKTEETRVSEISASSMLQNQDKIAAGQIEDNDQTHRINMNAGLLTNADDSTSVGITAGITANFSNENEDKNKVHLGPQIAPATNQDSQKSVADVGPCSETAEDQNRVITDDSVVLNENNLAAVIKPCADVVSTDITSPEDDEVAQNTKGVPHLDSNIKDSATVELAVNDEDRRLNSNDQSAQTGSAFSQVPKKKKQKQRFKEISAKQDKSDQDLMSAYVDKPVKEEFEPGDFKTQEQGKEPENLNVQEQKEEEEEITWEDKEHDLANKSGQVSPKVTSTAIISSEDGSVSENTKLEYDRDFLLKFQFAPICTEKPKDLPNIEIVLNRAHEPTKPIAPRPQDNDLAPHFMRSVGGNRYASVGRGGRGRGGIQVAPKKIITTTESKPELKRSENAWVRPAAQTDGMSEEEKSKHELYRSVRSILNKLTPQKFEKLVEKMLVLNIDTSEKLDGVIDLIFQKAISEPGYSVAYAKMCKFLANRQVQQAEDWSKFRTILVNKCEKEFKKEKADEKTLRGEREKKFEKPEDEKARLEELGEREVKQRRRTLGNIRFIGELFKLKMLKESIMHQCIVTLMKNVDEDATECMCNLLKTIGVDLDHEDAKPRMDQYFSQMNKMIAQKKLSSRVTFMLRDVIELRANKWVPRREGEGPKTIDQIHKEAKIQHQKVLQGLQEDSRQRKTQGGRDSPHGRTSVPVADEGWTNVASKSRQPTLDPNKLKVTKRADTDTISLGPGGRGGSSWAKGAGVGLSRSPASESYKQENRFSALSDQSSRGVDPKGKGFIRGQLGNKRLNDTRTGLSRGLSRDSQPESKYEKEKAIAAVRQLNDRQSRTPSPSVSFQRLDEDRSSQPSSAPRTPSDSPAETPTPTPPPNVEALKDKIRREAKLTVDEFIHNDDVSEAAQCVKNLNANQYLSVFVSESINHVLETKGDARKKVGKLLHGLMRKNVISVDTVIEGLNEILEFAEALEIDICYIWSCLGEIIGNFVHDGIVPLSRLKESVEPLIQSNKAGKLMAEILSNGVKASSEEQIAEQWHNSGLTWKSLLKSGEDVDQFIKDKKMEFTNRFKSQSMIPHASQIQEELRKLIQSNDDRNTIIKWVESNVPEGELYGSAFLRSLATLVCEHCVEQADSKCTFNKDTFGRKKDLLAYYRDKNPGGELQILFSVQKLFVDLGQPSDFLSSVLGVLYDDDIIGEEAVNNWADSNDEPHGKSAALAQAKGFVRWLRCIDEDKAPES